MKAMLQSAKNRIIGLLYIHFYRKAAFHSAREEKAYLRILYYLSDVTQKEKYWILLAGYYKDHGDLDSAITYLNAAKNRKKATSYLWQCRKERVSLRHGNRYELLLEKSA